MSQRHATDVVSLVFGTIFAGCTLIWALALTLDFHHREVWWAGPLVLVVAGATGLVAALRASRSDDSSRQFSDLGEPADPPG